MSVPSSRVRSIVSKTRILVVENSEQYRLAHEEYLRAWGFEPILAEGEGQTLISNAIKQALKKHCHIALIDLRLYDDHDRNEVTGLELAKKINPSIAIIVSGTEDRHQVRGAMKTFGVFDFVGKDDGPEELRSTIDRALQHLSIGEYGVKNIIWTNNSSSALISRLILPNTTEAPEDEAYELVQRLFRGSRRVVLTPINDLHISSDPTSVLRRRSLVFLTTIDDRVRQCVVKLAQSDKIEREIQNFDSYVDGWLKGNFHPRIESREQLWNLGGIAYSYIGDLDFGPHGNTQTLIAAYRSAARFNDILVPLHTFFERTWSHWYTNHTKPLSTALFTAYDMTWDGALSEELTTWSNLKQTRVFPSVPVELPDPRHWLADNHQECHQVRGARIAVTHGDLHGDNLFVDDRNAWPIDFERTGPGPILRDFVELIQDLLTRAARFTLTDLPVFYELAVAICTPIRPDQPMQTTQAIEEHPEARKAFAVVQDLQLLAAQRTQYTDRREYLWGLLLNSLFVVRLLNEDEPRREITLLLAAVICDRLARWNKRDWRPKDAPPLNWITPKESPMIASDNAQPVSSPETKAPGFRHGYALLVGAGGDLPATVQDASAIRDILTDPQRCAYPPAQVRLLTETQATRQGLLDGLGWLTAQVRADPDATVVLYFSGHGIATPGSYLMPYGYRMNALASTAVSGAELSDQLHAMRPRQLVVLLDCCHAGGLADIKAPNITKAAVPPELTNALATGSGRVLLASSRSDQVSLVDGSYSVFTHALCEALAGHGASTFDGYARIGDIAMYLSRVVPRRTQDRQHPVLDMARSDNFVVAYYAGGAKEPQPLTGALAMSSSLLLGANAPPERLDTAAARGKLKQLSNDEFAEFLLDHFPDVAQALGDSPNRAQRQNYLLDYCARKPEQARRLRELLL